MDLEKAKETLEMWKEAERAVATGQRYKIGSRELVRAELPQIAERIKYWEREVARLSNGGKRVIKTRRIVPRDL